MDAAVAPADMDLAVRFLEDGGVVVFPTETFYGAGADAENPRALQALARIKRRGDAHPFPLLIPDRAWLSRYADSIPPYAQRLADTFWPGPLTLVLESSSLHPTLIGAQGGAGFRVSSHPVAAALVRKLGRALTATSANRTGETPAKTQDEAACAFEGDDVRVLKCGETPGGPPSTVVSCLDSQGPKLIRAGAVPWDRILKHVEERAWRT